MQPYFRIPAVLHGLYARRTVPKIPPGSLPRQ